jgi:hypothetical protein
VEIVIVLFVSYVGYALGKSDLHINPTLTAVTAMVAVMLHGIWQLVLPDEGFEWVGRAVARPPQSPIMMAIALIETAGIWISVLAIRWAARRARIWAAVSVIGAATVGAFAHYAPSFDGAPESDPEYEAWLVRAFVFAAIPFAIGCIAKGRQRTSPVSGPTAPGA